MIRPSFRDPAGCTWVGPDVVHRAAWEDSPGTPEAQAALETLIRQFQAEGKWIAAKPIDPATLPAYVQGECPLPKRAWEHPRVFFSSYAHEWSPGMVQCAAALTLELNKRLLEIGWELKDATPSNILFEGPNPIFVDHLSPSLRKPGQLGWTAYGQFIRTFLIPLCLHRLNGLPISWLYLACRDGLSPEVALPQVRIIDRLRPSVFQLIALPSILSRLFEHKPPRTLATWKAGDEPIGRKITNKLLNGLQNHLHSCSPPKAKATVWSDYEGLGESYSAEGALLKEAFVAEALKAHCSSRSRVLDLGCNAGRYSRLAVQFGAHVISVDSDVSCIDQLWYIAHSKGEEILPICMGLDHPSPGMGWNNLEDLPFLSRVNGKFKLVIMLALIHHLIVMARIPIKEIIAYLANTTEKWVVVEWVSPKDPQFQRLSGTNSSLYSKLSADVFENLLSKEFRIEQRTALPGGLRILYLLEKQLC